MYCSGHFISSSGSATSVWDLNHDCDSFEPLHLYSKRNSKVIPKGTSGITFL